MNKLNYTGLLLFAMATACHSPADQKKDPFSTAHTVTAIEDKKIDSTKLIIAGKQAGSIYLGQDMQAVFKLLGRPDDGDAAMGSALAIWNKKEPLLVFSSYRDSNMVIKGVKQISVSAPGFSTAEGIHTGISLKALMVAYPELEKAAVYTHLQTKAELTVYDAVAKGIAFDVQKDTCTAITIHPSSKSVNEVYLTMYPGWKKL
ncbi:hypothetical protein AY601_0249 [Pedobacter cryoconitis]|uniref:Lipoprotein n=1 Tax=Pedobacter cryoconitis TaxID=188932 RepID=A0A127V8A9_9SPHI|nr:hypothetical protein [Pedobacter cryoconitis]AMP97218.1 hypothetical protein AY601_0249 [Pedobacter cryoconitis]